MNTNSVEWDDTPSAHVVQKFQSQLPGITEKDALFFIQEKISPFMTPSEVADCIASYKEQLSLRERRPDAQQLAGEALYFSAWAGGAKKVFSLRAHHNNLELIIVA